MSASGGGGDGGGEFNATVVPDIPSYLNGLRNVTPLTQRDLNRMEVINVLLGF